MSLDAYKVVLYRNQPDGWVAEVPAIHGCYALMPTREEALAELAGVFEMIAAEYREKAILAGRQHCNCECLALKPRVSGAPPLRYGVMSAGFIRMVGR